ncbi:DUF6461 domain-containing protein [Streptomyces sp. M19]
MRPNYGTPTGRWCGAPERARPARAGGGPDDDYTSWMEAIDYSAYCVTVIHDVTPDEALRRVGAEPAQITTGTWLDLLERAEMEETDFEDTVVAAFALGPHTLLVEENGWQGTQSPEWSEGTFAVSSYMSVNADFRFLVSRDGRRWPTTATRVGGDDARGGAGARRDGRRGRTGDGLRQRSGAAVPDRRGAADGRGRERVRAHSGHPAPARVTRRPPG